MKAKDRQGGRSVSKKAGEAVEVTNGMEVEEVKTADPERVREPDDKPWVRLSINLARDVAAALRELVERHGTSATEEVRRAISIYKFIDDETRAGNRVLVERGDQQLEIKFF